MPGGTALYGPAGTRSTEVMLASGNTRALIRAHPSDRSIRVDGTVRPYGGLFMRTLVGTVGQSVLGSDDGERWERSGPGAGFHSDAIVRTLVNRPETPHVVWAGTDQGVLRSEDGGRHWKALEGALKGQQVWRISF